MYFRRFTIATIAGMTLLGGHLIFFVLIWSNSMISPSSKSDLSGLIIPLTVALVMSVVRFGLKRGETNPADTPKVNSLYSVIGIGVPVVFVSLIVGGLLTLENDNDVSDFKSFLVTLEAAFGGILVLVVETLFGSAKGGKDHEKD